MLTARACADSIGFTPEWIRGAITKGVAVRGRVVTLEAEALTINGRRVYRIHLAKFVEFLTSIGWKRLPTRTDYERRRPPASSHP